MSRTPTPPRPRRSRRPIRPVFEPLECRRLLDGGAITVGRTLSSYTLPGVTGNTLTVTYTVFNATPDPVAGVVLTTSLRPGVTLRSASAPPAAAGSNLSWSLGTVDGYGRSSVSVTVALAAANPTQVDAGASAVGTLAAATVTDESPPVTLRPTAVGAELLAATPDADAGDLYIQEQAAALDYDPQRILNFLRTEVGYESYAGSLRGARGTLWSGAGNALDEASLGVALLRASGVPARYAQGTLPDDLARALTLSMFPAPLRVAGAVDPGTPLSDPAGDPRLMAEARDHYWFQYDTGAGFRDFDPSVPGAAAGQTFAATSSTFAEVPDALRHKVEVKLVAETAGALSGLVGGPTRKAVVDVTFTTAELVGNPLTVGQFVSATGGSGLLFATRTVTYSPFVRVDRGEIDPGDDPVIRGVDFQEVLTNFPLGSVALTGLVVETTLLAPESQGGRPSQTYPHTVLDRIGFAARQGGATGAVRVDSSSGPGVGPLDLTTLVVSTSRVPEAASLLRGSAAARLAARLDALPTDPTAGASGPQALGLAQAALSRVNGAAGEAVLRNTDDLAALTDQLTLVRSYPDSPRVVAVGTRLGPVGAGGETGLGLGVDLLRAGGRSVAGPGQAAAAGPAARFLRGLIASKAEGVTLAQLGGGGATLSSAYDTLRAAADAGSRFVTVDRAGLSRLAAVELDPEARARVTRSVLDGRTVLVPTLMARVAGAPTAAWFEVDPSTGDVVSVAGDGTHNAAEYTVLQYVKQNEKVDAVTFEVALKGFLKDRLKFLLTGNPFNLAARQAFQQELKEAISYLSQQTLQGSTNELLGLADQIITAKIDTLDPPVGALLYAPPPLNGRNVTGPGLALDLARDPIFSVPLAGAQVPTVFRLAVRNGSETTQTVRFRALQAPGGFTITTSVAALNIPAGQTGEVGVILRPTGAIPAAGTAVVFAMQAVPDGRPELTAEVSHSFTMPEVHGVSVTPGGPPPNTLPGTPVAATFTLRNGGNVPESVTLTTSAPAGLAAGALPPVSLGPGESRTVSLTLTPAPAATLNTTLTATVTATFGAAGTPQAATLPVPVLVAAPGAKELADAAAAAGSAGRAGLAARLADLGSSLSGLVLDPGNAVLKGQSVVNLDAVVGQLRADPFLGAFADRLAAARGVLATAATSGDVGASAVALGDAVGGLGAALSDAQRHAFTLAMTPGSAVALAGAPARFQFDLKNTGDVATTYTFDLAGLPAGVTGTFNTATVTLQPGDDLRPGPGGVELTLTQPDGQASPFGFGVTVSADGAPAVARTVTGTLTARDAFVRVVSVDTNPGFVDPGGSAAVTARVLNAVGREQRGSASFAVFDPSGQSVFTSAPVPVTLGVVASLATVDLGRLDTTGLPRGDYTLTVTLTDEAGQPLPGGRGSGHLLVGSPVVAALATAPSSLATGDGTVSTTLTVGAPSGSTAPPALTLLGLVDTTATGSAVALRGNLAYVAGTDDVSVVDVADPTRPRVVATFAGDRVFQGGGNGVLVVGNRLLVSSTPVLNGSNFSLLTYDLADPVHPAFLGKADVSYLYPNGLYLQNDTLLVPISSVNFIGGSVTNLGGDLLSVDLTDPTRPRLADVLFNNRGSTAGGDFGEGGLAFRDATTAYVASTTARGSATQAGVGRLRVVDLADPSQLAQVATVDVPGTLGLLGVSLLGGHRALVTGSTGGLRNPFGTLDNYGLTGTLTLTVMDTTDPRAPRVEGTTLVTPNTFATRGQGGATNPVDLLDLGNGLFAVSGTLRDGKPGLLVVDPGNPAAVATSWVPTSALQGGLAVAGRYLYTASADGLGVYDIGSLLGTTATVSVDVPKGPATQVVAGSFSLAPSQVVSGVDRDTLVWQLDVGGARPTQTVTWDTAVAGLTEGESRPVTLGGSVAFVSGGQAGTLALAPTAVAADPILGLSPAVVTAAPGTSVAYTVTVHNPSASAVTYALTVQGVPAGWVGLTPAVTVAAGASLDVPLTLTSDAFAAAGDRGFTVLAAAGGARGAAGGTLVLAGDPPAADDQAHGVLVALTPAQAAAGRGTPAAFTVRLINTGTAEDVFTLAHDLPAGVSAVFGADSVSVPPGPDNFRDVTLIVTPGASFPSEPLSFHVEAAAARPGVSGSASGALTLTGQGVGLTLGPAGASAGSALTLRVTNHGLQADTFALSLAGPGALVATLGRDRVTLAPGASVDVPVTTRAAGFALPGALGLIGVARSQANADVAARAAADLAVAPARGLTAAFTPATRTLPAPAKSTFLLQVANGGNVEESYTATITSVDGPVTAALVGLDGRPAQTVTLFRLPALATGTLLLQTGLSGGGRGTVTVQVRTADGALVRTATAEVTAAAATVTRVAVRPGVAAAGAPVTLTATVAGPAGSPAPGGRVTFLVDGQPRAVAPLTAAGGVGVAVTTVADLAPGAHLVRAVYGGAAGLAGSASGEAPLTVTAAGPLVVGVDRYGLHAQPTTLVVRFDRPLDPARAADRSAYVLTRPGGRTIPVVAAVYDPATRSVRLTPSERLDLHRRYVLTVKGTGPHALTGATAIPLTNAGRPGLDVRVSLTAANLVLPAAVPGGPARLARWRREVARMYPFIGRVLTPPSGGRSIVTPTRRA